MTSSFNMSSESYRMFYGKTKIYDDTIHFRLSYTIRNTTYECVKICFGDQGSD